MHRFTAPIVLIIVAMPFGTCAADTVSSVTYALYPNTFVPGFPRSNHTDTHPISAQAGDSVEASYPHDNPDYDFYQLTAGASGQVGGNGTNGLGLMRLNASVNLETNDITYPLEPGPGHVLGFYDDYTANVSGSWLDTLRLPTGTTQPVYLKVEVSGALDNSLRPGNHDDVTEIMQRSTTNSAAVSILSGGHPNAWTNGSSASVSQTLIDERETDYDAIYYPDYIKHTLITTIEDPGWASISLHDRVSFDGIALLPVLAPVDGDPSIRQFMLETSLSLTAANGYAAADLGHTVSFLGVTDADGNPISGASFESGLTPASVPEPSSLVLSGISVLASGLFTVWSRRGR